MRLKNAVSALQFLHCNSVPKAGRENRSRATIARKLAAFLTQKGANALAFWSVPIQTPSLPR